MLIRIMENKWHSFILILLAATASTGSLTACPPPPECDTPDRYVLWASENGTTFAHSENNDKVYINYYGGTKDIKYSMVPQNNLGGVWYLWAEPDYGYSGFWGCGSCWAKNCSWTNTNGSLISQASSTITVRYNEGPTQPSAGYVRAFHNGWECYKVGYGRFVIYAFTAAQLDVYIVKVDIKRNGVSIRNQNPTVSVGEKITLTGTVEPAALVGQSPQWDIDNSPIKNYIANTNEGRVESLTSLDKNSNGISYYWYIGADDVYVGYTVIIDGSPWGASTSFDVKRPSAGITTSTTSTQAWLEINTNKMWAKFHSPPLPGITFHRLNYNSNGAAGTTLWIQKINQTVINVKINGNWHQLFIEVNKLDSVIPYSTSTSTLDSPDHSVTNVDGMGITDSFSMWLMFKPNSANSIYIPISKVDWHWSPTVELIGQELILTDNHSVNPTGTTTTSFPTWNGCIGQ